MHFLAMNLSLCDCLMMSSTIYIYIHKAEKLSVRLHFVCIFCVELILTVGAWIDVKLAQNESYVFWHQQVYLEKFLECFSLPSTAL